MKQHGEINGGGGITWEQFYMLNHRWANVCLMRGWKPNDRQQRLQVFSEAVGRRLTSAKELNWASDVDRVKKHLDTLAVPAATGARGCLSAPAQMMLETLFRRAVQVHCRQHSLDQISAAAVEKLRAEWTRTALGIDHDLPWQYLRNQQVDRLKPYLILQADPDNAAKQAAVATAGSDGQQRVIVAAILEKVRRIRQIHSWLVREFDNIDLSPESLDAYVHEISTDTRSHTNWRALLLPILEEVLITVEERRREHVRLLKLMYSDDYAKDLLKFLDDFPDQYAAITTKHVADAPLIMTLEQARAERGAERLERRKRRTALAGKLPSMKPAAAARDPFITGQTPF